MGCLLYLTRKGRDIMLVADFRLEERSKTVYGLWQWHWGQVLRIAGLSLPVGTEVHFAAPFTTLALVMVVNIVDDNIVEVKIPNQVLVGKGDGKPQTYDITAYIYLKDDVSGQTKYSIRLPVKGRQKPEDYIYTPTELLSYKTLLEENQKVINTTNEILEPFKTIGSDLQYTKIEDFVEIYCPNNFVDYTSELARKQAWHFESNWNGFEYYDRFNQLFDDGFNDNYINVFKKLEIELVGYYNISNGVEHEYHIPLRFICLNGTGGIYELTVTQNILNFLTNSYTPNNMICSTYQVEFDISHYKSTSYAYGRIQVFTLNDELVNFVNLPKWNNIMFKFYIKKQVVPNDISQALDILNGEVI